MKRSTRGAWVLGGVLLTASVSLVGLEAVGTWSATEPGGSRTLLEISDLAGFLAFLGAIAGTALGLFFFLVKATRLYGTVLVATCAFHLAALSFAGAWIHDWWRARVENRLAQAQPVISAITRFTRIEGHPPDSLRDLVPLYLAALPSTGMGGYPEFEYERDDQFDWRLRIDVSVGFAVWSYLEYNPRGRYPARSSTRLGGWAHVYLD